MRFLKTISSLLLITAVRTSFSCAPSPDEFYPYYHPSLATDASLVNYWFDPGNYINGRLEALNFNENSQDSFTHLVLKDWSEFSNLKYQKNEIHKALFKGPKSSNESAFVKWLFTKKGGKKYYELMHSASQFTGYQDAWQQITWTYPDKATRFNSANAFVVSKTLKDVEDLRSSTIEHFLLKRLNYLEIRLQYYLNNNEKVVRIFDEHFASGTKNWLHYSAKYYYILCNKTLNGSSEFLKLWRQSRDKKQRIVSLLRNNLSKLESDQAKGLYLTEQQLNDIEALKIMRDPSMNSSTKLKELIAKEPSNPFIPMLLTREINKVEDLYHNKFTNSWYIGSWFYDYDDERSPYLYQYPAYRRNNYYSNQKELIAEKIRSSYETIKFAYETYPSENFGLMLAYCEIFVDQAESAKLRIAKITEGTSSKELKSQAKHIKWMALAYQNQWIDKELQEGILDLISTQPKNKWDGDYQSSLNRQTLSHLCFLSALDKKYTLSYFLGNYPGESDILDYAPDAKVFDRILNVLKNPRDPFEEQLVKAKKSQGDPIYTVKRAQSQWFMRNGQYQEAITLLKSVTNATDSTHQLFLVNFEGRNTYKDKYYHKKYGLHPALERLSTLIELSKKPGPKQGMYQFLVGNAILSMSNGGDNSVLASSMRYNDAPHYLTEASIMRFYDHSIAEPWFAKAFANCSDPELAALITMQWGACKIKYNNTRKKGSTFLEDCKTEDNPQYKSYMNKFGKSYYFEKFGGNCDNIRLYFSDIEENYLN